MKTKIGIIGGGGWGTALALVLSGQGNPVTVWGHDEKEVAEILRARRNELYLPGVVIPPDIAWTSDSRAALRDAGVVVMAVPSNFYRSVLDRIAQDIPAAAVLVSVEKGFDGKTGGRLSTIAGERLGADRVAVLSGPSHAEEVARGVPTAVVIACPDAGRCRQLQSIFMTERFRIYTSEDVIGVELGGALKNVVAVAVGVSDGLGFGDNTRAALIARGLAEITRLGCALGAQPETFAGLSGVGDLVVTCSSRHSRNRMVGERLGKGESIESILGGMKQVAEGVVNAPIARKLAMAHGVDVPITEAVYGVIAEGRSPRDAVRALMMRDARPEVD